MASKPLTIITDREPNIWEKFLLDSIKETNAYIHESGADVKGVCFTALMDDGRVLSGYEQMDCLELANAAASTMLDAVELFIQKNFTKWLDMAESGELDELDESEEALDE